MDRTDIALCLFLMSDSRAPYHELAAKLGLSINAVHKRIMAMTKLGIIRNFTARPSLTAVGAVSVWVFGRSEAPHPSDVHLRLREDDRTYWVANSGGGYVYVGGYLRSIGELEDFVSFVRREGEIRAAKVGILPTMGNKPAEESLRPLDYQILRSLGKDSRKPASEVAVEVKASAKTVHRRLEWMLDKGLVEFNIDWYPDASNDIVSLCHVKVEARSERGKVLEGLRKEFHDNMLVEVIFSNEPSEFVLFLWTNTMKQMEELRGRIVGTEGVESGMLNVLQIGYMFDTWRDKLVLKNTGGPPKLRERV